MIENLPILKYEKDCWWAHFNENAAGRETALFNEQCFSACSDIHLLFLSRRRIEGYETVEECYRISSCSNYMDNITVPMVFINAEDDPLVPESLLRWPLNYSRTSIFLMTSRNNFIV